MLLPFAWHLERSSLTGEFIVGLKLKVSPLEIPSREHLSQYHCLFFMQSLGWCRSALLSDLWQYGRLYWAENETEAYAWNPNPVAFLGRISQQNPRADSSPCPIPLHFFPATRFTFPITPLPCALPAFLSPLPLLPLHVTMMRLMLCALITLMMMFQDGCYTTSCQPCRIPFSAIASAKFHLKLVAVMAPIIIISLFSIPVHYRPF